MAKSIQVETALRICDLEEDRPLRDHPVRSRQVTALILVLEERLAEVNRRLANLEDGGPKGGLDLLDL